MHGQDEVWWRQADQFNWFSTYLRDRGLRLQWRLATFVFTVVLGALPLVMLGSTLGPNHTLSRVVAVVAAAAGLAASTLWLLRWPTRRQSIVYNFVCSMCTAATCLSLSSPYAGLMGCTIFAVIGGFVAYFHVASHLIANLAVATVCTVITAAQLARDTGDTALTVAAVLTVVALNVGVPFGIYSLVHSLRTDLRNSDRDPLTGLLNRRSFYNAVHELIVAQQHLAGIRLNITMIDLDDFKGLNDTRGHAAGDQALVGVGAVLRTESSPGAVLARLGGEEFVIADTDTVAGHASTAERIRSGVAAMPFQITASLGTCSTVVDPGSPMEYPPFIDRLIQEADAAMYTAKRAGGDGVRHWQLDDAGGSWAC